MDEHLLGIPVPAPRQVDVQTSGRAARDLARSEAVALGAKVQRLAAKCNAREMALERMAAALRAVQGANRALTEENAILRHELARHERANAEIRAA